MMIRLNCQHPFLTCKNLTKVLSGRLLSTLEQAKPFEEIATPPGGWVPFVGHSPLLAKPYGIRYLNKNAKALTEKFLPPGDKLLRLKCPPLNPDGNGNVVLIYDPSDVQEVYRNEGKYPYRGQVFSSFKMLRSSRPDLFGQTYGVLIEEGEKWHEIRSKVQQDMMRPKSATFYLDKLQDVSNDFVKFIRRERNPKDLKVGDFLTKTHMFGFESITVIALDTRLGCLDENLSEDLKRNFDAIQVIVERFPDLLFGFPWWKVMPKRWSPLYRTCEDNFHFAADFVKGKINEAIKVVDAKTEHLASQTDISILEKMIIKNGPNSPITFVMAFDMVIAGIDTTGNTMAFLMYNLARNPDKQEKLRQEILSFGRETLTLQDIGKMPYFRACLQESFRLTPTVNGMMRVLPQETVLGGHRIPAGTMAMWFNGILGQDTNQFKNPEKFIPERWIEDKKAINPFSVRNFSHGPRMCIGKRFAELEIQIGISKLLQNFNIEWAEDYDIEQMTELVNVPNKPLTFKFTDI